MQKYIISFILLTVSIIDCDREKKMDCTAIACSQEFRIISISIKHVSDSSAFILTTYKVLRVSDDRDITHNNSSIFEDQGYYPVVDDTDRDMLRNSNVEVEFQGYVGDTQVIKRRFIVTADCCHVSLVSGGSVFYI
jgi:hypothetical protein